MSGTSLLIDNVRLWDGIGSATQPHMAVEVQADRISWVGPASEWPGRRAQVEVVDGTARTLIPGLIDCHVHYGSPGGPDWIARFTDPPATITFRAMDLAGASLRSGITSARDVGAPAGLNIRLAHAAATGAFPAPPAMGRRDLDRPSRDLRPLRRPLRAGERTAGCDPGRDRGGRRPDQDRARAVE